MWHPTLPRWGRVPGPTQNEASPALCRPLAALLPGVMSCDMVGMKGTITRAAAVRLPRD